MSLKEQLGAIAEREPAPALPTGFFERARRRARRRRLAIAGLVLTAMVGSTATLAGGSRPPAPLDGTTLVAARDIPNTGGLLGWGLLAVVLMLLAVLWRDVPRRSLIRRLVVVATTGALLILSGPPGTALWGEPQGRTGLPQHLAEPNTWTWTANLRQSPIGPAGLVFSGPATYGNLEEGRLVQMAADGDRYRVLDVFSDPLEQQATDDTVMTWPVLSPDGRYLAAAGYGLFDLTTGRPVPRSVDELPAAWSADGRREARPVWDYNAGRRKGWQIWDVRADRMLREIPFEPPGEGAIALSPDGSRAAVEQGDQIIVYAVDGSATVSWSRDGWSLGDSTAWSPDGRRLAMVRRSCVGCGRPQIAGGVRIVDAETGNTVDGGSFPELPAGVAIRVQGWRSPSGLVVQVGRAVDVFSLESPAPARLLTLPAGVTWVEIPTSMLAAPLRPAEPPTYGPPNMFLWLVLAFFGLPLLLVVLPVVWLVKRLQRNHAAYVTKTMEP